MIKKYTVGSTAYIFGLHPFRIESLEEKNGRHVYLGTLNTSHRVSVEEDFLSDRFVDSTTEGQTNRR